MQANRSALFWQMVVVVWATFWIVAATAADHAKSSADVTQTPAFKACMQRLAKTVATADLTDPDHAENVRGAVNVCSHGKAGKPPVVTVEQTESGCVSFGYSKQTCHAMVDATIHGRAYSGPDAFVPPDASARGPAFARCMQSARHDMPHPAPWQAKLSYQILAQGCIEGEAGIPLLNTDWYCRHQADTAGGSNVVELQCRRDEDAARDWLDAHTTSERTIAYCKDHAGIVDGDDALPEGSYNLLKTCIEQEDHAEAQLRPDASH